MAVDRVDVSGEAIRLSLAVDFLYVMYIKDTQMLAFNFTFHLLWTGRGSSVSSVDFEGFYELKYIEKRGSILQMGTCVKLDH
jgi:hypothetical protein